MQKIGLEWRVLDRDHVALVFDKTSFKAFQDVADQLGVETTDMIANAVVKVLGPVVAARFSD
ncbi:MAG TPA: hypothetical protein VMF67_07695 [Rhizomicrobium sp.]|nr:hypothetical protein [Rhizomicrobium sp.]